MNLTDDEIDAEFARQQKTSSVDEHTRRDRKYSFKAGAKFARERLAASTPAASPIPIDAPSDLMLTEEEVREAFNDVSWDDGTPEWIARMNGVQLALLRKVAASAVAPQVDAPRWMPIAEAPTNGTRIMLGAFPTRGMALGSTEADYYHLATWDGEHSHPYIPNNWTHFQYLPAPVQVKGEA